MRKYLSNVIDQIVAPKVTFNSSLLSLPRYFNKRNQLKKITKMWGYRHEDEIDKQIASVYLGLSDALNKKDEPMILRFLSIELYEKYKQNPELFKLNDKISDISIMDCKIVKDQNSDNQWVYLDVVIKNFNIQHNYTVERRLLSEKYKFQNVIARKWFFSTLPLTTIHQETI